MGWRRKVGEHEEKCRPRGKRRVTGEEGERPRSMVEEKMRS